MVSILLCLMLIVRRSFFNVEYMLKNCYFTTYINDNDIYNDIDITMKEKETCNSLQRRQKRIKLKQC